MSSSEDLSDVVRNFVDKELASLDRVGGESESFTLSPHLAQPSPDIALGDYSGHSFGATTKDDNVHNGEAPSSSSALKAPGAPGPAPGSGSATSTTISSEHSTQLGKGSDIGGFQPAAPVDTAPHPNAERTRSPEPAFSPAASNTASSSDIHESPASQNPERLVKQRQDQLKSPSTSTVGNRHASSNSTASVSTAEREKRQSLGDKFKAFGKRITSGSSAKK